MTESEREATRRRLAVWQGAEAALEEQRWRELMALTIEEGLSRTRSLLGRQGVVTAKGAASGLVEQQALFRRSVLRES